MSDVGSVFSWEGNLISTRLQDKDVTTESSDVYPLFPDARGSHTSEARRNTAGTYNYICRRVDGTLKSEVSPF